MHTIRRVAMLKGTSIRFLSARVKTGGQVIHDVLENNDVRHVFGYSGGAILPVLDQFHKSRIEFIMNRNEQCAGHAATGYSKSSGKIGVIVSTSGPGVTNLVTPLQDALNDGVPLIALTGQVPTGAIGTDAFQECDATAITKPCTKWSYQLKKGDNIEQIVNHAFNIALSNRKGPVHIDLPKDIMINEFTSKVNNYLPIIPNNTNPNKYRDLQNFISLLKKSKRPVIIAGNGCIDAQNELREFVNKVKIPVTTTLHGMGVYDERDELSLHMVGMHGSIYANYAVQNSDLVIGLGCRYDDRITGNLGGYARNAFSAHEKKQGGVVHINNCPVQQKKVQKIVKPTTSILYDAKEFLVDLMNCKIDSIDRSNWIGQIKEWKKLFPFEYKLSEKNTPKTQQAIHHIYKYVNSKNLNNKIIVSTGVGNHQMMAAQFYRWTRARSIITSGSLGVMGAGLPFAIGAQFANPDMTSILIDGDGSFNMTLNDLGTVAENNLPIKMFIMNDKRQQMVHVWQQLFFGGRITKTDNVNPDYVKLAESFGIQGIDCESVDDIDTVIELAFETNGPVLVNFNIDPDICLPLVPPGKPLHEMLTSYKDTMAPMVGMVPS